MSHQKFIKAIFCCALVLLVQISYAQTKLVTGRVTDPTGAPVAGVSVVPKGGSGGVPVAADGTFKITVKSTETALIISGVGFVTQQVNIANVSSVEVHMLINTSSLGEVVVIGYGTAKKKDLTGSVASITSKDFQKGSVTTPEQLIAGKVAGVSIISNSGHPGAGSTIRIRGGSSLSASNDPLIVIDGVPLDNSGIIPGGNNNPLSFVNPNDIESFTILKDASAAAIYGTRAANGVIIITTKKGRGGKLKVSFSSVNSISSKTKEVSVLNGNQVRSIVNAFGTAAQKAQLGTANTDWQNLIYQSAFATDNNVSLTGGIKGLPYRLSLGYTNQDGILKTDNLQRFSGSVALNPVLFDNHLKLDINFKGTTENNRDPNTGAIGNSVYFDPTQPVYSTSKRWGGYFEFLDPTPGTTFGTPWNRAARNPLAQLYDYHNTSQAERSIGNVQADYKLPFFPDLHLNANVGYDISSGRRHVTVSDSSSLEYATGGESNNIYQRLRNTLAEFYLNYNRTFKSLNSTVDAIAGYSYNDYLGIYYNYPSYTYRGVKVVNSDPNFPFDKPEHTLISYFGRANFTIMDKYLLTGTIRRDGSSRFAPKNRWATFPSVAFAWKIKEESFLKNSRVVSDLKLRLGYGLTGQQDGIGNYDYLSYYALSGAGASYQIGNTFYKMFRPGGFYANRKWEQTATYNAAMDFGFLNNRINGSVDFYLKKTTNLLNSVPQPAGTNFAAYILANVGSMENRGVEFTLTAQPIRQKAMTWDVAFNATYNRNRITNLTVLPDDPHYIGFPSTNIAGSQGFAFLNAVGGPKNTFYLYHQIYDANHQPIEGLFEDVNRDGIINENDKYKGKSADPNLFFGFSTSFTYHKWSAGFVLRASFNNYVYNNIWSNNGRLNQILGTYTTGNASSNYLTTHFAGTTDQQLLSDYYLQNGSFLKMDNANIGYEIGRVMHNQANLRLNATVQNVFTITKYKGLDPEINNGVDNNLYPRPRIIALGINLDF